MADKRPIAGPASMVLAAGGSSRYGRCKQLVEVNGCSLVRLGVDRLSGLFAPDRIIVVVGADSEAVAQAVGDLPVKVVLNKDWRQGLASSLKAGLNSVEPDCGAVLVTLCDQALVTEQQLRLLLALWNTDPSAIVASAYAGTVGTPAIIPARFYPQIMALEGDTGAKSILKNNAECIRTLPLPEAGFDLDVPTDLPELKKLYLAT